MSSPEAYDAIETRLKAAWLATAAWSDIALVFENEPFKTEDSPKLFVYVEIFGDELFQESVGAPGNNLFQETGIAYVHVMVPKDTGTRKARSMAKAIANLFREQNTDGVMIDRMAIGNGDPGRDFPRYWAMTLSLNWYRREFTSLP